MKAPTGKGLGSGNRLQLPEHQGPPVVGPQRYMYQHPIGTSERTLHACTHAPTLRSMVAHELSWWMDHSLMRQSSPPDSSRAGSAWGREEQGEKRMKRDSQMCRTAEHACIHKEGTMPLACRWQHPVSKNVKVQRH